MTLTLSRETLRPLNFNLFKLTYPNQEDSTILRCLSPRKQTHKPACVSKGLPPVSTYSLPTTHNERGCTVIYIPSAGKEEKKLHTKNYESEYVY